MYPTVSDLINDLFGFYIPLPIQTFGFFVAISFILGAFFWAKELKRKEEEGLLKASSKKVLQGAKATPAELVTTGIVAFILGYKILYAVFNYSFFVENPQAALLSLKGNFPGGIAAAALAVYLRYKEKKKEELPQPKWVEEKTRPHEHVGNMTIYAALFGLLGAKIFHLLENPSEISGMFDSANSFFSGLTMYGGLIVGGAAVLYYAHKHGMNIFHVMDASAPALMLAYGFGRLGCQFSGDGDWGIDNLAPKPGWLSFLPDWVWAYNYPHNVISAGIPIEGCEGTHCFALENPVFPTPLYEAVICIGLFGLLWSIRKKINFNAGIFFCIYLILNGIERFFIEKIRINTVYQIAGKEITQAEIIAVLLVLVGTTGIILLRKRKDELPSHTP